MPKITIQDKKIQEISGKVVPILKKNGVVKAGIFGSYARGEAKKKSDIDILIKIRRKKFSLLDLAHLKVELEEELHKEVDLVEYGTMKSRMKQSILSEEIKIL